ncbi:MAG: glycosyltransferase family 4 protein [Chloracidobacterium sp.]|nr:glycosyltransferase family 4 protein [Chloracidobacterium sp.]
MKVFYPVEVFYPSQAGGTANALYWLTKNLVREGFEPVVVASNKGIGEGVPLNEWIENDSGKSIFVRTRFLHVPVGQTLKCLAAIRGADIVHLSSVFYPAAFLTGIAARLMGKKIAWSPHGELTEYALNYSAGRKRPILWLLKKVMGRYPLFHSTSDEETEDIRRAFGRDSKIVQITNYVEVHPVVERTVEPYLLYIGRIHPKKAIDNLIRAAGKSQRFMESEFVLKIAGRGREEHLSALKLLVEELSLENKVQFIGQVEGEEKFDVLAGAYFTLMPSHSENFGIVVLESLSQNTPVVASIYTPWESLEKERIGFWTDNSVEALAAIIDKIISMDSQEYAGYRARGREFVCREFDISSHMDKWLDFYRSV